MNGTEEKAQFGRFAPLLVMLSLMLVAAPIVGDLLHEFAVMRLLFAGLYIGGVAAVARHRWMLAVSLVLALPALLTEWGTMLAPSDTLFFVNTTSSAAFLAFTAGVMLHAILTAQRVNVDTVLGGVCVYLLIGFVFVEIFTLIEAAQPGSFAIGGEPIDAPPGPAGQYVRYPDAIYFSFVTFSTLGYGDVAPLSPPARAMASTEAVLGQLYLAVFVARLVGLHLADARRGAS